MNSNITQTTQNYNDSHRKNDNYEAIYENLNTLSDVEARKNCCINNWITSIIKQVEDYDDPVQYNVKCIPSRTFGCSEFNLISMLRDSDDNKDDTLDRNQRISVRNFVESRQQSNRNRRSTIYEGAIKQETTPIKIIWRTVPEDSEPEELDLKGIPNVKEDDFVGDLLTIFEKKFNCATKSHFNEKSLNSKKNNDDLTHTTTNTIEKQNNVLSSQPIVKVISSSYSKTHIIKDNQQLITHTYNIINKCLLSISLNTITVMYDKNLKLLLYHFNVNKQGIDYLSSIKRIQYFVGNKYNKEIKFKQTKNRIFESEIKKKELKSTQIPDTIVIRRRKKNKRALTHPLLKHPHREIIYQPIWNCKSYSVVSRIKPPPTENIYETLEKYQINNIIQDDHNWEVAHDDFSSADDIMDVVDFLRESEQKPMISDHSGDPPRTYTKFQILYNTDNPNLNRIYNPKYERSLIGVSPRTSNNNSTEKRFKITEQGRQFIENNNETKRENQKLNKPRFTFSSSDLSNSVKDFMNYIRNPKNVEDEEDVVRNFLVKLN